MPEFCSCGAELPPDALFCHKCGKPQRDLAAVEPPESALEPVRPPKFTPAGAPSFRNPVAVKIGITLSTLAALLSAATANEALSLLWFFAAGFAAPFLFSRRTGLPMSMRAGARVGWITGVFGCLLNGGVALVGILLSPRPIADLFRERLEKGNAAQPEMQPILDALLSPAGLAVMFALSLAFLLLITTLAGALGAKIAQKD
jgi:hypothetical protein